MTQNLAELELKYHDVTALYDLAEELVDTVESEFVSNQQEQMNIVENLIETVGESADILSEEFIVVAGNGKLKPTSKASKNRIETAMRKVFVAIEAYNKKAAAGAKKASETMRNIADPVVEKIKRQMDVIISVFIEFVDISLERIMQKAQIEELKKRQERIAIMLHDIAMSSMEQSR
jgi:hypothetical protein